MFVDDRFFDDFESVWVQHRWTEYNPEFRFTTADIVEVPGQPPPKNWQDLQFKPGDPCTIYLGNNLAVTGIITLRQTAYDANNKGVQFQGVGVQWAAARSSIVHKTNNFDGKNLIQFATEILGPTGVPALPIGMVDPTPFKQLQVNIGEPIGHALERASRMRGVILGSDHLGNFLLIGEHGYPVASYLIEGVNILRCQATIWYENIFSKYIFEGQTNASDDQHGRKASEQEAVVPGSLKRYSALLTPMEHPVWSIAEVMKRAQNEAKWHEGTKITATITTQGWVMPGTRSLWMAGGNVKVQSPMAMLNLVMKAKTVTFTQDRNAGTLTTLELVPLWGLNDQGGWDVSNLAAPQAPEEAAASTGPPTTDPPQAPPEPARPTLR